MRKLLYKIIKLYYLFGANKEKVTLYLENWENSLNDTRKYYLNTYQYFTFFTDKKIVTHRDYFRNNKKGFGEDSFHIMWEMLYDKFQYENFLEIGVYRGQTISLNSLLSKIKGKTLDVHGISPFDQSGDSVSNYISIDFLEDTLNNFNYFELSKPSLLKAYSTDQIAIDYISNKKWDCIYIDGSHDLEIVRKDWALCSKNIKLGGIIVMDDSSMFINYKNPFFSFKGHRGPSIVSDEIAKDNTQFKEILRVGHNRVFQKI